MENYRFPGVAHPGKTGPAECNYFQLGSRVLRLHNFEVLCYYDAPKLPAQLTAEQGDKRVSRTKRDQLYGWFLLGIDILPI